MLRRQCFLGISIYIYILSIVERLTLRFVLMQVKIIGVELADANAMALSLHHGERVVLERVGGFADGIAVKKVGEETFRICRELIDGVVLVNRDAICASIKVRSDFESQINIVFQIPNLFDQVPIHLSIRLV